MFSKKQPIWRNGKSIEIRERILTNCVLLTLVQSEQSLSIKNDQKQDVLPTKDMEKHSSGQNKNERGDLWVFTLLNISSTWKPDVKALRPIHLYLIFEKSSLKNQVRRTGFLTYKKQFQNWFLQATQAVKIQFEKKSNSKFQN